MSLFFIPDASCVLRGGRFGLVFPGNVVFSAAQVGGQILLLNVVVGVVVGILVALEKRALQMQRDLGAKSLFDVLGGGVCGGVCRVGLGRGRQHYCGVSEGQARLGHTQLTCRHTAGVGDGCRLWVGKSYILIGDDLQAAADGDQLAQLQQFDGVKYSRIGVGAANGLLQAGQQVVVCVVIEIANTRVEGVYRLAGYNVVRCIKRVFKQIY